MPRANLAISLRNAMSSPHAQTSDGMEPPTMPSPPPPVTPAPRLRRRLLGWLAPLADYGRRYVNAGTNGQLQVMSARIDALQAQIDAGQAQIDTGLGQIIMHLADADARQEADALQIGQRLSHIERRGEHLAAGVDDLRATVGPRFDELEIKVRPLILFDEESYAIRVRDGYAMLPRSEPLFAVMVANAMSGGLEPGTRHVLQALIRPGMNVADVGANVGLLTLACAFATGPTGKVYAFEPEGGPRRQLLKTVKLNGLKWVDVSDRAVGDQSGPASFNVSPIIGHSSLLALPSEEQDAARTVQVQVTRLDDAVPENERLDVVKIDVEGGELGVLQGMSRLLAANPDIALVAEFGPSHLRRLGIDPGAWMEAFAKAGLTPYLIIEPTGLCRPTSLAELKDVESVNLAFVRPGGEAQERLPR